MRHPSVVSLSLSLFRSFARGRRRRQKNIDDAKKRDIYQNIFRIQKDHPPPKEKGSSRANYIAPRQHHHHHHHHSRLQSRAQHTQKKTYLHRRRRNLRASERRRSLRGRRRRRANRRERLDGERGGQHFMCNSFVCSCVRLNNEEFILFRSLSFVWQSTRGGVLVSSFHKINSILLHITKLVKVFQNEEEKFSKTHTLQQHKNRHTHTHRYSRERERKTPHERRQREGEKMTTTTRRRREPVG